MSNDALRALADRLEAHTEQMANTSWGLTMQEWNVVSNDILLAARTLRAALTPPADGTLGEIRARHDLADNGDMEGEDWDTYVAFEDAHTDRATLLRAVDRLSAEMAKERERRVEVEGALIDLNTAIDKMWNDTEGRVVSERHALDITHAQRAAAATLTKDTP